VSNKGERMATLGVFEITQRKHALKKDSRSRLLGEKCRGDAKARRKSFACGGKPIKEKTNAPANTPKKEKSWWLRKSLGEGLVSGKQIPEKNMDKDSEEKNRAAHINQKGSKSTDPEKKLKKRYTLQG